MSKSEIEEKLAQQIALVQLPDPVREHCFHPDRMWRFDFSWPDIKLAVEVEGGVWVRGRHTRGAGFIGDCEKYNEATMLGWRVLRFTGSMIESGQALDYIERAFKQFNPIEGGTNVRPRD